MAHVPAQDPLGLSPESLATFCGVVVDLVSSMVMTSACGEQGDRGSSVIFSLFPTILLED